MANYRILHNNKIIGVLNNPDWINYDDVTISAYCAGMLITLYRPGCKLEKVK